MAPDGLLVESAGLRGCGSMAERKLPKLETGVRFPSPAPPKGWHFVDGAERCVQCERLDGRSHLINESSESRSTSLRVFRQSPPKRIRIRLETDGPHEPADLASVRKGVERDGGPKVYGSSGPSRSIEPATPGEVAARLGPSHDSRGPAGDPPRVEWRCSACVSSRRARPGRSRLLPELHIERGVELGEPALSTHAGAPLFILPLDHLRPPGLGLLRSSLSGR